MQEQNYKVARLVFRSMTWLGWALCLISLLAGIEMINSLGRDGAIYLLGGILAGVVTVALSQIGLAHVDMADTTASILAHLKSGSGEEQRNQGVQVAPVTVSTETIEPATVEVYKEQPIVRTADGFEAKGKVFSTVHGARAFIDVS